MALSANQAPKYEEQRTRQKVPVAAGAIHVYQGALLNWNSSGYVKLGADTAGEKFCGLALEELNQATGGADGDKYITVIPAGSGTIVTMKTGTISAANIGDKVYVNGDDAVALVGTTTNDVEVGVIRRVISTTSAEVQI